MVEGDEALREIRLTSHLLLNTTEADQEEKRQEGKEREKERRQRSEIEHIIRYIFQE